MNMTLFGAPFIAAVCFFALIATASCGKRNFSVIKAAINANATADNTTLTKQSPGIVRLLTTIKKGSKWTVNFPGGLAQVFAIGDATYANSTVISVNGSKEYKLSGYVNSNKGLQVSAKQIVISNTGDLPPSADILLYLRDKKLRDAKCDDPVVITNWKTPSTPADFTFQPINSTDDCAVTVFSSTMRTSGTYTLSFPKLSVSDKATVKAIPGVYQSSQPDDITLFSFTSSDSQKWINQTLYQRAITFIVSAGSRFNGTATANNMPSPYRMFKKGDKGCITSRQYPAPNYFRITDKYTVESNTTTLYQLDLVSAEVGGNGTIDIATVPASAFSRTIRNATLYNQQYKFKATSFTINFKQEGKGERGFLLRYSEGTEAVKESSGERAVTVWWITALFALLAVRGNQ